MSNPRQPSMMQLLPDPTGVQAHRDRMQGEGAAEDILYHSVQAVAHVERLMEQLPHARGIHDIDTRVLHEATQELRRVVFRHGHVQAQGERPDGPRPAA